MKATKHFLTATTIVTGNPTQLRIQTREQGAESDRLMGLAKVVSIADFNTNYLGQGLEVYVGSTLVKASNLTALATGLPAIA